MNLLQPGAVGVVALAMLLHAPPAAAQALCRPGFVWRGAFPGDAVCVSVERRQQVADENAAAAANRQPDGGGDGPNTCRSPFVWRLVNPKDLVCVSPEARDLVALENTTPQLHAAPPPASPPPAPAQEQIGEWSPWATKDGVRFRYQWKTNPQDHRPNAFIQAVFDLQNLQRTPWLGTARTESCQSVTLGSESAQISLQPNERRTVTFITPNCGTPARPFFKSAGVAHSSTL